MKQRHYLLLAVLIAGVALVALAVFVVPRSAVLSVMAERQYPGVIPSSRYVRNLDSADPDLVDDSFFVLAKRQDPVAVPRAIELLNSPNDYIWLNAALYLGACQRQEAVPYLIKALRHTAWRSDPDKAQALHALTGADFGTDFGRWQEWWLSSHPQSRMDWGSHLGPMPRLPKVP